MQDSLDQGPSKGKKQKAVEDADMDIDYSEAANNGTTEKGQKFQKREFNPDEWELVDEDECVVELVGMLNRDYLHQCDKDRVKIVGLFNESGKVFLQLDQLVFTGEPSETFGSNVLFEEVDDESSSEEEDDDAFAPLPLTDDSERKINLRYATSTRKKITMSRAFLTKKT